jgi:hypothetical protein
MKKEKALYIIGILVAFLLALNLLHNFYGWPFNKKADGTQEDDSKVISSLYDMMKGNQILQFTSNGYEVSNLDLSTSNKIKTELKKIVERKAKVAFRISENHCQSCIEEGVSALLEIIKDFSPENFVILTNYSNVRALKIFIQSKNLKIEVINIAEDLGIPAENFGVPYFFVLNPDLSVYNTFIPMKEINDYTSVILRIMVKNLNQK